MSVPTFLSDEPTLTDLLGRMTLAKQIGDTVASCAPPCVLGIHGDWGSGKTSFLHTLQHYLTGECPQASEQSLRAESVDEWKVWKRQNHIAVIWFEAWRYQQELVPVVPLLHEIRAQLSTPRKLIASAKKLGEVAIKSALFGMEGQQRTLTATTGLGT